MVQNDCSNVCSCALAFFQRFVLMNELFLVLGSCVTKEVCSKLGLDDFFFLCIPQEILIKRLKNKGRVAGNYPGHLLCFSFLLLEGERIQSVIMLSRCSL